MITEPCPWAGKNLPPINDHAFWRMLRVQCNTDKPLSRIAAELGVDPDDLCAWIMAYRSPHAPKQYQNKGAGPIGQPRRAGSPWTPAEHVRRQTAWERSRDGAAEARKAIAE